MSAISRAMAAPVEMATPASASDRAGESLTPSPTMMTVCPAAFSLRMKAALSSGRTSAKNSSTPTSAATAAASAARRSLTAFGIWPGMAAAGVPLRRE